MLGKRIQSVLDWLKRVVTEPRSELTRWQKAARFTYDLGRVGARQLQRDKAPQMAAALSYRTLFGLMPVLVVATLTVGAFRGSDAWLGALERTLDSLELNKVMVADPQAADDSEGIPLTKWLLNRASQAEKLVSFTAVGGVGAAILIYSAISLMVTIENSFNSVYRAPSGRSWGRRLPVYWTVLTLGPIVVGLTAFANSRFTAVIVHAHAWQWVLTTAPVIWSFTIAWLLMLLVYKLVPNTSVSLRPALVGSFISALLFQAGGQALDAYFEHAVSLRQLWGSLAFIPLFMFWVYVMWLVILFGLEVSATLQALGGRRIEEMERPAVAPSGLVDPASVVTVMEVVAERFAEGRPCSPRAVAEATDLPEGTVVTMLDALVQEGLLYRLEHEESMVTLARPPEQINAARLMEIGYELVDGGAGSRRSELVERLRQAQRSLAAQATLRPPPAPAAAGTAPG